MRHGAEKQKREFLPRIAAGKLRLQAFGVTEPTTGTDTTQLKTTAVRKGDRYVVNGQKVWISRAEYSDLMLLVARTIPVDQVKKRTDGLSILLVDLRQAVGHGLTIRQIRTMMNHATTEIFFDNLEVPVENRIGEEDRGFRYLLDGLNAERILIAAECVGDGRWFVERACRYAKDRIVFARPIGQNQGIQFPIARARERGSCRPDANPSERALRSREIVRGLGEHGQAPRSGRLLGGSQCGRADVRRLWVCGGVRHRAEVPRDPALPGRPDFHQHGPGLRRRARAGSAQVVLMLPLGGPYLRFPQWSAGPSRPRPGRRPSPAQNAARRLSSTAPPQPW